MLRELQEEEEEERAAAADGTPTKRSRIGEENVAAANTREVGEGAEREPIQKQKQERRKEEQEEDEDESDDDEKTEEMDEFSLFSELTLLRQGQTAEGGRYQQKYLSMDEELAKLLAGEEEAEIQRLAEQERLDAEFAKQLAAAAAADEAEIEGGSGGEETRKNPSEEGAEEQQRRGRGTQMTLRRQQPQRQRICEVEEEQEQKVCARCSENPDGWPASSAQWKKGPTGPRTLCNHCALSYRTATGNEKQEWMDWAFAKKVENANEEEAEEDGSDFESNYSDTDVEEEGWGEALQGITAAATHQRKEGDIKGKGKEEASGSSLLSPGKKRTASKKNSANNDGAKKKAVSVLQQPSAPAFMAAAGSVIDLTEEECSNEDFAEYEADDISQRFWEAVEHVDPLLVKTHALFSGGRNSPTEQTRSGNNIAKEIEDSIFNSTVFPERRQQRQRRRRFGLSDDEDDDDYREENDDQQEGRRSTTTLTELDLSGDATVESLQGMRLPCRLESLNLSRCCNLTQSGLAYLPAGLQKLSLAYCAITDMALLHLPHVLRSLGNCSSCSSCSSFSIQSSLRLLASAFLSSRYFFAQNNNSTQKRSKWMHRDKQHGSSTAASHPPTSRPKPLSPNRPNGIAPAASLSDFFGAGSQRGPH
ncbi:hypothetical protein QOT17_008428 [Balamuthia mandrillaris]